MKLNQYLDNHQTVYKVRMQGNKDIVGTSGRMENVTRGQVRSMFEKFIQASPEQWSRTRTEQIAEFNAERRKIRKPMVEASLLMDLDISLSEEEGCARPGEHREVV